MRPSAAVYDGGIVSLDSERDRELEALRTQIANQAASLAETVRDGFDGFHIGAGDYIVDLKGPEGPSTGGGAQARQNVRLVPRRKGYAAVVAGTVDPVTSSAEVRTFEHVAVLHELRFRRPLEINAEEYAAFLTKLDLVLNLARVRSRRVPPPPELLAQRKAIGKRSVPAIALLVFVVALAAGVVYRVMQTLAR
jgi:translation initiation factor IF-2